MARPSHARRSLKWIGLRASLLILVIWIASLRYGASLSLPGLCGAIGINCGEVYLITIAGLPRKAATDEMQRMFFSNEIGAHDWDGFGFKRPEYLNGKMDRKGKASMTSISIPFWLPVLLTAIPTAWLWHRDRRRIRPGCCLRCGYDLTGNTSGVCPECGDKVHPPAVLADSVCGEKKAMANSEE